MVKRLLILFISGFFAFSAINAAIKMPAIFCDNMVLQQNTEVLIWGWGNKNSTIKVSTSWNNNKYTAKSDSYGYWKLKVSTPPASFTPYTINISDGESITLKNVLIGEVWICSGQSNMEMPMKGYQTQPVENSAEDILYSGNEGIRLFTVARASTLKPQEDCKGKWEIAEMGTVANFSATAYYFGRMINKLMNIPVGLINTSWGGSSIQAWMPEKALQTIPEKKIPRQESEIKIKNQDATLLFNGMLNPLVGYGIKGFIWYQGEANRNEPELYTRMFKEMVDEWRKIWNIGEFPVYYTQLAGFNYPDGKNSALIREAQEKCMEVVPNTGMAVTLDSKSPNCIHPPQKKEVGERLAFWALNKIYGYKDIPCESPKIVKVEKDGRMIILTTNVPDKSGLTSYDKDVKSFMLAGENKIFYPAKCAVFGNKIYLFSPRIAKPVTARYCFEHTSVSEIYSLEGNLPLSSFRLDDWAIN